MELTTPLSELRGVGAKRWRILRDLGLETVEDLLHVLPVRYDDRRSLQSVGGIEEEGEVLLRVRVQDLRAIRTRRKGLTMVRGSVVDDSGKLTAVWFNRPYLTNQIDPGATYVLQGRVRRRAGAWELLNAQVFRPEQAGLGSVRPVYPALGEIGGGLVARWVEQVFAALPAPLPIPDPIPSDLLERHGLPSLAESLRAVHRAPTETSPEAMASQRLRYRDRLAYGELLELQLVVARAQERRLQRGKPHRYRVDDRVRKAARGALPFRLTGDQKRALKEIVDDLRRPAPMARLLQGDVGSGKTIVAALALLIAAESRLQGVLMVPTEVLAEQQCASLRRWLGKRHEVGLLTGSSGDADVLRRDLAAGRLRLVVGTHALIQREAAFDRLGLVVVDEQHRFGVAQRQAMLRKGRQPDLLVMTATPIPRSLALTVWGDLERSTLRELPAGRLPVSTEVLAAGQRFALYERLGKALDEGARAYVVLPRIEDEGREGLASLAKEGEEIRALLAPHEVAVAHGRMPGEERSRVLARFAAGEVPVLLATTVVEVGLDVPEATWMVIENGERFGLAQLHQLRGRVGRGSEPSTCVVLHAELSEVGERRLAAFAATTDGFQLAERDLQLRGPGDLLGLRQAGLPALEAADLLRDREWLDKAREDARELLRIWQDETLRELRPAVERRSRTWRRLREASS